MNSNTYNKLTDDIINQIKDFDRYDSIEEEESLIDELIPNEELRERYKKHGLCKECSQPNSSIHYAHCWTCWCQSCNSKHFQQDFNKWTSGNKEIDEFIQKFQLNATYWKEVLELEACIWPYSETRPGPDLKVPVKTPARPGPGLKIHILCRPGPARHYNMKTRARPGPGLVFLICK